MDRVSRDLARSIAMPEVRSAHSPKLLLGGLSGTWRGT